MSTFAADQLLDEQADLLNEIAKGAELREVGEGEINDRSDVPDGVAAEAGLMNEIARAKTMQLNPVTTKEPGLLEQYMQ